MKVYIVMTRRPEDDSFELDQVHANEPMAYARLDELELCFPAIEVTVEMRDLIQIHVDQY